MKLRITIICLFILSHLVHAQPFGGNPPSIKWKQIETPSFKIIFPEGLSSTANRVATIGERILPATAPTIGAQHRKINIVLQNQTMVSNGYVSLGPWRSEFYLTPLSNSLDLGSLNWADMLTLHEVRHIQQFSNFKKGLAKYFWILGGEQGQALANVIAIPDWFFEGDAVFQETLLSEQGRGRLPSFVNDYRAIDAAGIKYNYAKLRNGSYRKMIPNHYTTGYILVSEARKKYGSDVWKKITERAVQFKPLIYPMQGAFKAVTKQSFSSFVKQALYADSLQQETTEQAISPVSNNYVTDYAFPQLAGKDSLIVLKQTDRSLPAFYWVINGEEKRIRTADVRIDPAFSYRQGKLAFTSYMPDARWGWRNYSDIVLFDIASQTQKRLTHKGKYFAPDISHDGKYIAAVFVDPSGKQSIQILNAETGEIMHDFSMPNEVYSYPKFSKDDQQVFALVRQSNGWMGIQQMDLKTRQKTYVLEPAKQALSFLYLNDDKLYFTAAFQDRDRLMIYDLGRSSLHETYTRAAGVQQGIPIQDSIVFTGLSAWGNRLYKSAHHLREIPRSIWQQNTIASLGESAPLTLDTIKVFSFPERSYRATTRLFNFHSWRPYYDQPDWSFTVYGQNILNTFQTEAFVSYNENEGFTKTGFNALWGKWFPWITMGTSYTSDRNVLISNSRIYWNEWNANAGLRLPLNLTKGRTVQSLTLSSQYNLQQVYYQNRPKENNIQFGYMDNQALWSISSQQAKQHIFPRLGLAIGISHRFSVSSREARQFLWRSNAYLPGLLTSHNLVINAAYQARDTANQYQFSNSFPLSRGYTAVNLPRMMKLGINYHFPICYPDWGVGNMLYLLRIRGNMFFDHSEVRSLRTGRVWKMNSTGPELFVDLKWWNQQPLTIGFRYSFLLSDGPYTVQPAKTQFTIILPQLF